MSDSLRQPVPASAPHARAGSSFEVRLLWASLVPLLLLLRPYQGLIQDARIYIGSGLAERDPQGIGRDLMFTADGQTGFTLLKPVIRALLAVATPSQLSIALASVGSLLWLGAVAFLCRTLARGRTAWAAAVCVLTLPAGYGAFGNFVYGEAIATPRVFAEAAVLAALAALVQGRRIVAALLLATALALHPLMALPGLGVAAAVLAWNDRRWLPPIGAVALVATAAAALKLPLAERLFEPMDADWLAIVRTRTNYLFPSLWDGEVWARIATRFATIAIAATVAPPRMRVLLWAALGIGAGGLALSAVFADYMPLVLVTQVQPWRALWLPALFGNASVAFATVALWRRGTTARLTLAVLALSWLAVSTPPIAAGLAAAAVALRIADAHGTLAGLPARTGRVAIWLVLAMAAADTIMGGYTLAVYLQTAWSQGGTPVYAHMLLPMVHAWPMVFGSLALALRALPKPPAGGRAPFASGGVKAAATLGMFAACCLGLLAWSSNGNSERRMIEGPDTAAAALRQLIGPEPGSLLWVDDYDETWFLAGRAAYFTSTQGGPILFSRRLAFAWFERARRLVDRGLARHADMTPWMTSDMRDGDLPVSQGALDGLCREPDHPVAVVLPGAHLDVVPPGRPAGLWHPAVPAEYVSISDAGLRWHRNDSFTVIRCGAVEPAVPAT